MYEYFQDGKYLLPFETEFLASGLLYKKKNM